MERNPFKELQDLGDVNSLNEDDLESLPSKESEVISENKQVEDPNDPEEADSEFELFFNKENHSSIKGGRNRFTPKNRSSILKSFDPLYVGSPTGASPISQNEGLQITAGSSADHPTSNSFMRLVELPENETSGDELNTPNENLQIPVAQTKDDSFMRLMISTAEDEVRHENENIEPVCEKDLPVNANEVKAENIENIPKEELKSNDIQEVPPVTKAISSENITELRASEGNYNTEETQTDNHIDREIQTETKEVSTEIDTMTNEQEKILLDQIAELKQQLSTAQQARADLEQQLLSREDVSRAQGDDPCREIRELKEKLDRVNAEKARLIRDGDSFRRVVDEYNASMTSKQEELQKLKEENSIATRHLANLELAFRDVLEKYDRCKGIIEGYKSNEETLRQDLALLEDKLHKNEEKYEALKAHAKAQLERSNKEIVQTRETFEAEITKLHTIIKRQDIKNKSLVEALDQKIKECSSMAALFDEMTGKM